MSEVITFTSGKGGVGKTTTCQVLKTKLDKSVFLDGDWCWNMHPFVVNKETKKLVLNNICALLNNDIKCNAFENIIFCWVMHEQSIIDDLLSRLDLKDVKVAISLVCQKEALEKRIQKDIDQGIRKSDVLKRSIERMEMYQKLDTYKIDVSYKTVEKVIDEIMEVGICQAMGKSEAFLTRIVRLVFQVIAEKQFIEG